MEEKTNKQHRNFSRSNTIVSINKFETIVMSWWDSLPEKMQEELRNFYEKREINITDFQEHIVKGVHLLSYDELKKVNNYVNSFINYSSETGDE